VWLCGVCAGAGVWVAPEGVTKGNTVVNAGERGSKARSGGSLLCPRVHISTVP